ncbi:hypothetical protein LGQ02_09130 [Bacillus shivajii]|uniref:hypothetical protein n=1 Tax=Bacillus shivajii TaxID=1983719 RepID=UPI001CF94D77|nr:hypothetical protein [Bacillus shivajii]UCZ54885.1 hypothetical protein LGQ02_09130 [Bacillus shivajii]
MGITIFFFASWLVCVAFAVMPKKLSLVENTFVYLIILIVSINFSWIIIEEFKFITLTEDGLDYTAHILNRSVILPMLIIMQLNLIQKSNSVAKSVVIVISTVAIMLGLSFLSTQLNITTHEKWNFGYEVIYFLTLHLIGYYVLKAFRKIAYSEVKNT